MVKKMTLYLGLNFVNIFPPKFIYLCLYVYIILLVYIYIYHISSHKNDYLQCEQT